MIIIEMAGHGLDVGTTAHLPGDAMVMPRTWPLINTNQRCPRPTFGVAAGLSRPVKVFDLIRVYDETIAAHSSGSMSQYLEDLVIIPTLRVADSPGVSESRAA